VTDSRTDRIGPAALLALGLVLVATGCRTPSAPPRRSPVEPPPERAAVMPSDGDLAAADLAAAVLASDRVAAIEAQRRIETYEAGLGEEDGPSALSGYGHYALASTLDDPIRFRQTLGRLLDEGDLDPGLRTLLEQYRDDDPLRLASARIRDAWVRHLGTIFNQFAAPLGKSAMSGAMAFAGLARALFKVVVYEAEREAMDVPERQALHHWKRFVEEHPEAEQAPEVVERIQESQQRWNRLQRDRALDAAEDALENGQPRVALVMADRALGYRPEDPEASEARAEAARRVERWRAALRESEVVSEARDVVDAVADGPARALLLDLLGGADPAPAARRLLASDPEGPLADEARYVLATLRGERGEESAMWSGLETLAEADPGATNMMRHAEAAVVSGHQNPYRAFCIARSKDRLSQALWVLFGPLARGPRDRDLPRPVEWLVDLPTFVELFTSLPNRLVFFPWMKPWPFGKAPALFGRNYLQQHPDGEHVDEVAAWIQDWESRRGNAIGALAMARLRSDVDEDDRAELEAEASRQKVEAARREKQPRMRLALLKRVAREHPDTPAGDEAGRLARELAERMTPQRITLSRGFLSEHPHLAGPDGLGLDPIYLDGELRNGELHPEGVSLVGGRIVELSFLAASGDEDDPPERIYKTYSEERLSRVVSLLDETSLRLAQLESDYQHEPAPERDHFFERARLGLVSAAPEDVQGGAGSGYAYTGMRERYGLVRSRESILPFELVVQGSLYDFGFGVFPRINMPKPTPDAFLYK
jgi:hypothetical protein